MSEIGTWLRQAPFLPSNRRPAARVEHSGSRTGLVLSGGGARSSFQIGALRYLYERAGIEPQVITGTSAGAILGSVLAQHDDASGQRQALAQLEQIWSEMTTSADMFTELPWFARLREHMPTWRKVIAMTQRNSEPARHHHGQPWNPSTAWDALGTLWEAGRSSADLQTIVRGPAQERAAFTPGPIVGRLLDPQVFDPARLARSRVQLRIAMVGLESGELRYVTNTGAVHDRDDVELAHERVQVAEAVRASCAIPGIFPPVTLGPEHYVDGGIRENLPVQIAVEQLGVDRCFAVVASPSGSTPRESFAAADMFEIIMRAASGIMSDELQRDEIAYALDHGVTVINPRVDVHDLVTIDPGLIAIAIDYGYLRAQDVVLGASEQHQHLTDEIIRTRRQAWELEEAAFGRQQGSDVEVKAVKKRLGDLLAQVPAGQLPDGAAQWARTWERHTFEIEQAP